MHSIRRIESLVSRFPASGPVVLVSSVQYFLVQVIVASAWKNPPYSWRLNAISDLGAVGCGHFDDRMMCSPLHGLMNVSLIALGLAMVIGSALTYQEVHRSRVGFYLMAIAGMGAIVVGFFPLDTIYWIHIAGADMVFLLGNIALVVFGCTLRVARWIDWYGIASGVMALVAMYLFLSHNRFFLGLGGMERLVAYPQTIWLIVFGLYMSMNRTRLTRQDGVNQSMPG
jgi:hypothetical membrane protein